MADPSFSQVFPIRPARDYVIEHTHHEFTSVCPMTGHPDFGSISWLCAGPRVRRAQVAQALLHAFRNEGIFFEA